MINKISLGTLAEDATLRLPSSQLQFRIFSVLWAVATLFHMAHSSVFDTQLNFALLTLVAIYVVIRPNLTGLVLLITLQLFDAFFRMPFTTNHWIFAAFVNLTILQSLLFLMISRKSFRIAEGDLFTTFSPVVRVELIILYFFTVFHKLNAGFFTPETSCATDLLLAQNIDKVMPLTAQIYTANAYFTIILEASIPVLLCFRKTRNLAIFIGIIFHSVLSYSSYNAFYDFSSIVFAMYFLFADPAFSVSIYKTGVNLRAHINTFLRNFELKKLLVVSFIFLAGLIILYILNKRLTSFRAINLYFFWTVYSLVFTYLFIKFWIRPKTTLAPERLSFSIPQSSFLIFPIIVFLNGTSPYLGLKTENSYAMFSNLRTEGGISNHFLVPAGIQPFNFQREFVHVVSSTDPGLQKLASENKALVLFEFSNYVNERKPKRVIYLHNGKREIYVSGQRSGVKKNPYVLAKLMKFRPFTVDTAQPCSH